MEDVLSHVFQTAFNKQFESSNDAELKSKKAQQQKQSGYSREMQELYSKHLKELSEEFIEIWKNNPDKFAKLSDFDRIKVLGQGTFGVVFLAKHIESREMCAMKRLEKEKIVSLEQVEHSYYEKKVLCCLNFPFVISMKYFFKDNVYLTYVLPFINGGELYTHLSKLGRFPESTAKFYGSQVVLAFEYLHACNLVYRDLKPENIAIDSTGYIKLIDFGFCKVIHERTWTLCGTPDYIAPEIIMSKGYGKSVDWWAFGVLLFEMTAGYAPFFSKNPMKTYEKIVDGDYKCPGHFTSDLKDLINHTLKKDIAKRFGNLKGGVLDFKNHKWFKEIIWNDLLEQSITPPFVPECVSPDDTRYFQEYPITELDKTSSICLYEEDFLRF